MTRKVALFGGSFNPVHHGHLIVARYVAEELGIERVVLLPSRVPPHKTNKTLAAPEDRMAMVELATGGDALFEVSDHDLTCAGPSYTVRTVAHFRAVLPAEVELIWLVGADSLLELHTWYQVAELAASCRIVTAVRPGSEIEDLPELRKLLDDAMVDRLLADVVQSPRIDISATDIRRRVAAGRSIRYLVPESVEEHIARRRLYVE